MTKYFNISIVIAAIVLFQPACDVKRETETGEEEAGPSLLTDQLFLSADDVWEYAPPEVEVRARHVSFLLLSSNGHALMLDILLTERTSTIDPKPGLSVGDGYLISEGKWKANANDNSISVYSLETIEAAKQLLPATGNGKGNRISSFQLILSGVHLLEPVAARYPKASKQMRTMSYEPVAERYPKSAKSIEDQFRELCCAYARVKAAGISFCKQERIQEKR